MARSMHSKVPIDWSHRSWITGLRFKKMLLREKWTSGNRFDPSQENSSSKSKKSVSRPPPRSGGRRTKEKKSQFS
jgi:hypothetical protein